MKPRNPWLRLGPPGTKKKSPFPNEWTRKENRRRKQNRTREAYVNELRERRFTTEVA